MFKGIERNANYIHKIKRCPVAWVWNYMDTLGYKLSTTKILIDSFDITPHLRVADCEFDNWVCVPTLDTTQCTFCDKIEEFLSDEGKEIVTNGIKITDDAHWRMMATLKNDEDFDIGEN